ncbi:MAG: hypothetical protein M3289_03490, partial [Actinomycetota bacterium]|nr:hypothetical protein [Actinomycetota bacterium]
MGRAGIERIYRFGPRVVTGLPEERVGLTVPARGAVGRRIMRGVEAEGGPPTGGTHRGGGGWRGVL